MIACPSCTRSMPPQCRYCAVCGALLLNGLTPGQVVAGRFQILKMLSQRRLHALTYQAVEQQSGQSVVLREIREDLRLDPASQQELLKELKRLSQLKIAGVPAIRGLVRHENRAYLLMSFTEGHTLRQVVARQGPLNASQARSVLQASATILFRLHQLFPPLLHLDITPDTLLLSDWENVTLLDGAWLKTLGNPFPQAAPFYRSEYAAPETLRGCSVPASDIFSLGVAIIEAMTHVPAPQLHNGHINRVKWDPISDTRLNICLQKMVEGGLQERFQNSGELVEALQDRIVSAPPVPVPTAVAPSAVPGHPPRIGYDDMRLTAAAQEDSHSPPSASIPPRPTEAPAAPQAQPAARMSPPVRLIENIDELSPEEGLDALLTLYEDLNT